MYGIIHTNIKDVDRHPKFGVQVIVEHGRIRGEASDAQKKAQMLWVKTRLAERGDDSARDLYTYNVQSRFNETQVSLAADVHTW